MFSPHDDAIRRARLFGEPLRIGDGLTIPVAQTADDEWMRAFVTIEILREAGIYDRGELNACVCTLHDLKEKTADRLTAGSGVPRKIADESARWLAWVQADDMRHAAHVTEVLSRCDSALREHRVRKS